MIHNENGNWRGVVCNTVAFLPTTKVSGAGEVTSETGRP